LYLSFICFLIFQIIIAQSLLPKKEVVSVAKIKTIV